MHEDLRVVRTKKEIRSAFDQLICEKGYEKMTVKELCQCAGIGRKTFYLHYENLNVVLEEKQGEIVERYVKALEVYKLPEELERAVETFYIKTDQLSRADQMIFAAGDEKLLEEIKREIIKVITWTFDCEEWKEQPYKKYMLKMLIVDGVWEIYKQWKKCGKLFDIQEMVCITSRLIRNGVKKNAWEPRKK